MEEKQDNITPADNAENSSQDNGTSTENSAPQDTSPPQPPVSAAADSAPPPASDDTITNDNSLNDESMSERLERLGGEPAPVITPEEFARLQQAGQVHIDSRGRVRTARRSDAEAGVSLRKRRAWYGR